MRMWMVDPTILCNKHLLGEHGEIHKHRHNFVKGHSIMGRLGQIEPKSMKTRHDLLEAEMLKRGMRPKSPYELPDLSNYDLDKFVVDQTKSLQDLIARCPACRDCCYINIENTLRDFENETNSLTAEEKLLEYIVSNKSKECAK